MDIKPDINNTSFTNGTIATIETWEAVLYVAFALVCIAWTIVGNILVVLSVFTYRPLRHVTNFFIVSLAVSDLTVAICVMPYHMVYYVKGKWVFGSIFCNMYLTFDVLCCCASIFNLCVIAVDRYFAVHKPIVYAQKRTKTRVIASIILVWVAAGLISIPPLVGWNNNSGRNLFDDVTGACSLTGEKTYRIYAALGAFFIPSTIMFFVYVKIFRTLRQKLRLSVKVTVSPDPSSDESIETNKTNGKHVLDNAGRPGKTAVSWKCEKFVAKDNSSPGSKRSVKINERKNNSIIQFHFEKRHLCLNKERRLARTTGIIVGVFIICWLPFFLMFIIHAFCGRCAQTDVRVTNFIVWLGYMNSGLNPIIYTKSHPDFRRAFRRLLKGKCKVMYSQRHTNSISARI